MTQLNIPFLSTVILGFLLSITTNAQNSSKYNGLKISKTSVQTAKLVAIDGKKYDQFGVSVSLSGNRALIGANLDETNGANSGSAYIFELSAEGWSQTAKLLATDGTTGDLFGSAVSLSGDIAVIGAHFDSDKGRASGSVYVFELSAGSWSQTAKLVAADAVAGEQFGVAVSLSGNRVLIGARGDNDKGKFSGSAYIFELSPDNSSNWSQVAKLTATDGAAFAGFGGSLSLSGDRVLIGASGDNGKGAFSGSAYIFDLSAGNWSQTVKLTANDTTTSDLFGAAVSLSGDRALIGASGNDDNDSASGSAYIFDLSARNWSQTAKLTATDGLGFLDFGGSVSLSIDRALIAAKFDDNSGIDSGSAYIFELSAGRWLQTAKLTAADGAAGDRFGVAVSLTKNRALLGASADDANGKFSGSAYIISDDE